MIYGPAPAVAGVVIKIRAINPLETEVVAPIRYPLPKEVTPQEVIAKRMRFSGAFSPQPGAAEKGGGTLDKEPALPADGAEEPSAVTSRALPEADFKIKYDKRNGYYYVDHEVTLAPHEIVTLEIEVRDVWNIPIEEIEALRAEAEALLAGEEVLSETAAALRDEIGQALDQILRSQQEGTVTRVGVESHIQTYAKNREKLRQAQTDKKMLANLLKKAKGKAVRK